MSAPLHTLRCEQQNVPPLNEDETAEFLSRIDGWSLTANAPGGALEKAFYFTNFHDTMAFVNAVAWIAHNQDHHPDMTVSYNRCSLRWNTHSAGGLSINDFICAARVDKLRE